MKKLLLLLPFLCPLLLAAQVEFAPVGAVWYYSGWPEFPETEVFIKLEVIGIDTILGHACKRIEYLGGAPCSISHSTYFYEENGKVFYFEGNSFHLLYNFNAVAGESWIIPTHNPSYQDSLILTVDTVFTININGNNLKVQHLTNDLWWGSQIIEGIGSINFLFPQVPVCDPVTGGLRCYSDSSLDLHFVAYPCDTVAYSSSTHELVLRGGLFSPNPAFGNTLALSEDFGADKVILQNTLGTAQKTFLLDQNGQMEMDDVLPGIYFASVFKGNRLVGTDKLVVLLR